MFTNLIKLVQASLPLDTRLEQMLAVAQTHLRVQHCLLHRPHDGTYVKVSDGSSTQLLKGQFPASVKGFKGKPLPPALHLTLSASLLPFFAPIEKEGELLGILSLWSVRAPAASNIEAVVELLAVVLTVAHLEHLVGPPDQTQAVLEGLQTGRRSLLECGQQARALGYRPHHPHTVLRLEAPTSHEERQSLRRLQMRFPHSLLFFDQNTLTALLEHEASLTHFKQRLQEALPPTLVAGVSTPVETLADYAKGYKEASVALAIGTARQDLLVFFSEVGWTRYLHQFALQDTLSDPYQEFIERIVAYDRQKGGGELLLTMETYLEKGGHLGKTGNALFIHRNTLLQRLERLHQFEIDITDRSTWFQLHLALKVYRLRSEYASEDEA